MTSLQDVTNVRESRLQVKVLRARETVITRSARAKWSRVRLQEGNSRPSVPVCRGDQESLELIPMIPLHTVRMADYVVEHKPCKSR